MSLNKRIFTSTGGGTVSLDDTNPLGQATDTLVAFYDFNSNMEDSSGHNEDGTNTANGILTSTYLEIDGVGNDYVTLGKNYNIGDSVAFWFQIPSDPGAHHRVRVLSQDGNSYALFDFIQLDWSDTNQTLTLYQYARHQYGYSYKSAQVDDSNFTFGEWHFVVVNFTSFNTMNYSYDGSDLASVTHLYQTNGTTFYSRGPHVGRIYSNGVYYYGDNMYVDKLRIFDSELTNAQVQTLYSETPNT